jgi:argininosuccinate synthase
MTERVVLAYSGGLDTSVAVPWLRETHGYDVVALTADVGGGADLAAIGERALAAGASVAVGVDARAAFVESHVWPALQAGALYQGIYPLATALARPLIARLLVEAAHETGATLVAHGCTGKGNDQVRFDVAIGALDPSLTVIAPMRTGMGMNRDEELAYALARNIPLEAGTGSGSPFSVDVNLWGRSVEAGILEDPWVAPPPDAYVWTVDPAAAPRLAREVEIGFAGGIPVSLDGQPLDGVTLIEQLNAIGGAYGIGRIDHVEDRLVGIKSREIYEAPAAVLLHQAHAALEQLVLSRDLLAFKRQVADRLATLTYDGLWFGELAGALRGFVAGTQGRVNGTVRLRLAAGSAAIVGRSSADSLYRHDLATYGAADGFDHAAAVGFIELWGLPVRTQAAIHGSAIAADGLLDELGAARRTRAAGSAAAPVASRRTADEPAAIPVGPER